MCSDNECCKESAIILYMCDIYNKDVFKFDKAFVSEIVGKIGKDEMLK